MIPDSLKKARAKIAKAKGQDEGGHPWFADALEKVRDMNCQRIDRVYEIVDSIQNADPRVSDEMALIQAVKAEESEQADNERKALLNQATKEARHREDISWIHD